MAEKLDSKKAMEMTISQLAAHFGWSKVVVEYLVCAFSRKEGEELINNKWKAERENKLAERMEMILQVAAKKTLRDLVTDLETTGRTPQAIVLRLKEIGLTCLDTFLLPKSTVTFEMLKGLSRGELIASNATVLYEPRKTVAEVLAMNRKDFRGKGAAKALELLERLGFGPKDGPFMTKENDPRKILAKDLMSKNGLTAKEAKKFADIAAQRNWI